MTYQPKVLAVGASGHFAGLVVPELAKRGAAVRALIRHAEQEAEVKRNGAKEVALGDLSNRASLDKAMEGIDSVFYIVPAMLPNEVAVGQGVIAAAKQAGVKRIVFSALIYPILNALPHHIAKAPIEEAILASSMEFVFLQPAIFFQNITADQLTETQRTGVFAEPWSTETLTGRVDYRDVAEVAAIALTEDRLNYGTFDLCGCNVTRHDIAAVLSNVMGKPITADKIPAPASIPDPSVALDFGKMVAWYDQHGFPSNSLVLETILGRKPRTLEDYFKSLLSQRELAHAGR